MLDKLFKDFSFEKCSVIEKEKDKLFLKCNNKVYILASCFTCNKSILKQGRKNDFSKKQFCSFICKNALKRSERYNYKKCKLAACNNMIEIKKGYILYCSIVCQDKWHKQDAQKKYERYKQTFTFEKAKVIKDDKYKMLLYFKDRAFLFTACTYCKKSILKPSSPSEYESSIEHYCSRTCGSRKRILTTTSIAVKCGRCNKEFRIPKCRFVEGKYFFCSKKHADEAMKKGGVLNKQIEQTNVERFGFINCQQSPEIQEKVKQTNLERYGVDNTFQLEKCKENLKKSLEKNDDQASKDEKVFYETFLIKHFNQDDIIWHAWMNAGTEDWRVDFYIRSLQTWVQFDGVHWHGLNKKLDELEKLASEYKMFNGILNNFKKDRRQDEWFLRTSKKLIRIPDTQFEDDARSCHDTLSRVEIMSPDECYKYNQELIERLIKNDGHIR